MTKRDVEVLLADYDGDSIGALTVAMRTALDSVDGAWPDLVQAAGFSDTRTAALLVGEQSALDDLATELNETRTCRSAG